MPVYSLTVEYCGDGFSGWAAQPEERTVEGELTEALETILSGPVKLAVAGRTDAGVHALGQVASFTTGKAGLEGKLHSMVNKVLPDDICVVVAEARPDGFSARENAIWRSYLYRVLVRGTRSPLEQRRSYFWPHRCDFGLLEACADLTHGEHDFTAFTPAKASYRSYRRNLHKSRWARGEGHILEYHVRADSFMNNMVRILVGTMLEVASGRSSLESFKSLLDGAPRTEAGKTAPAHGLYLAGAGLRSKS